MNCPKTDNTPGRFSGSLVHSMCDCGFRGLYLSEITGDLSVLKKSIMRRRVEKNAKREGWKILREKLTHCPDCAREFKEEVAEL